MWSGAIIADKHLHRRRGRSTHIVQVNGQSAMVFCVLCSVQCAVCCVVWLAKYSCLKLIEVGFVLEARLRLSFDKESHCSFSFLGRRGNNSPTFLSQFSLVSLHLSNYDDDGDFHLSLLSLPGWVAAKLRDALLLNLTCHQTHTDQNCTVIKVSAPDWNVL